MLKWNDGPKWRPHCAWIAECEAPAFGRQSVHPTGRRYTTEFPYFTLNFTKNKGIEGNTEFSHFPSIPLFFVKFNVKFNALRNDT